MESIERVARIIAMPFGYLAFVVAIGTLSVSAWLLGDRHELGFFSRRVSEAVWRYPEVTRRGIQIAWVAWAALLVVASSPIDPFATRWDEVALVALGLIAVWRRLFGDSRVER